MSRPVKVSLYVLAGLFGLCLLLALAALLILPSRWFEEKVRARMVQEIERVTGGRTEAAAFDFDWTRMTARVDRFALHGTEPQGEAPLFRAASVEVGIKIVSMLKRDIDLASLRVEKPEINILVDEKGATNFPSPRIKRPSTKNPVERLLELAIQDLVIAGGTLRYDDRRMPLEVRGRNLTAELDYQLTGPSYTGKLRMEEVSIDPGPADAMAFAFDSSIRLEGNHIEIASGRLWSQRSNIEFSGGIAGFKAPKVKFDVRASGDLAELGKPLKIPRPHTGSVSFDGAFTYAAGESYQLAGKVSGRALAFHQGSLRISPIAADSNLQLNPDQLLLTNLTVKALDGTFTGMATFTDRFNNLRVKGVANGLSVETLAEAQGIERVPWDGAVSGPVELTATLRGRSNYLTANGSMAIAPVEGEAPLEGNVEFAYDSRSQRLSLGDSHVRTTSSSINARGELGETLQVRVETVDLNDLLPAVRMATDNVPEQLPVRLASGGKVMFDGSASGPLKTARVAGKLEGRGLLVRDQTIDAVSARLQAAPSGLRLTNVSVTSDGSKLTGTFELGLENWRSGEESSIKGSATLRGTTVTKLLALGGAKLPITGAVAADADIDGTLGQPMAVAKVRVRDATAYDEPIDRLSAELRYTTVGVDLTGGILEAPAGRVQFSGAYLHPREDWKNGQLTLDVSGDGLVISELKTMRESRPGLTGVVSIGGKGRAAVRNGGVLVQSVSAKASAQNLAMEKRPVGDLTVEGNTSGTQLTITANGHLRGAPLKGNATVQLTGDYYGRGELTIAPMSVAAIQDLLRKAEPDQELPIDGIVAGRVIFAGPARKSELLTARIEVPTVEIFPTRRAQTAEQKRELALKNVGPVIAELDPKGVHIRDARFVGPSTNVTVGGTLSPRARNPWDLRVDGELNLEILEDLYPDLVSSGVASVNAQVRGSLQAPQIAGRTELKNASFYVEDVPNGLDQVNGTVIFDGNRATIDKLTGQSGGGKISLTGFLGYGQGPLSFRLQGRADAIRIRYPEGVSTTANAVLSLSGTRDRSLLSGSATVLRAGFNPKTDIGGLLAASAQPVQTPQAPNELLRNLYLDIRVETIPNLTFQTTLTTDLQADADLRIRGTAAKPVVLGRIAVNQGEIQFFGNKYTINRGEIGFYNAVRVEPVLDMDLETRVRGVTVNMKFAGTLPNKLNMSYRSDPPLQTNEIIALLAVGSDPTGASSLTAAQSSVQNPGLLTGGTNVLLPALTAPVSSRLQRFFGVSRIKFDPTLKDLDTALGFGRVGLTIEQQVSRDITVTYTTNLADVNQQIVRVQWDINRTWSVVALREENGVFGIDFFFKKRFE
jgi:translocation and assembly module TamB